jgi:hypothetical protein
VIASRYADKFYRNPLLRYTIITPTFAINPHRIMWIIFCMELIRHNPQRIIAVDCGLTFLGALAKL